MKGSYKYEVLLQQGYSLVCDMEMKGSYKRCSKVTENTFLVCDMEMKGSYKLRSLTLALLLACM